MKPFELPPASRSGDGDSFSFETFNGNCLETLKARLDATDAWLLFAQETGILPERAGEVAAWAASRGWHFLGTHAKACDQGQTSGGAAVFARAELGLRWPSDRQGILVEHRLAPKKR